MTKGETPYVRILDKVVNCLYRAQGLSTALATIMTSITQHKITYGSDDNSFQFELEDIMITLKSHQIKLSHNLNPKSERANIAALAHDDNFEEPVDSDNEMANIAAFNGNRPKCEICFRPHSVKYCPYRGKDVWPPSIKKRANQYNLKQNEFSFPIPARDPRPPPQSVKHCKKDKGSQKKPLIGKEDKATISSMLGEYLQPDSTKEVSNRDIISINALASKYIDNHNKTDHPISTLALLENEIIDSDENMEINANIVENEQVFPPISHEELIKDVNDTFEAMDPYKAGIFKPSINFISEFQDDEESLDEETTVSHDDMDEDDMAATTKGLTAE